MMKSVLNSNIQIIITNMQHTIEVLTSICSGELLNREQMIKYANILNAKILDDDNYKRYTGDASSLNLSIKRLQSEKASLKKLINDFNGDIYFLNDAKDDKINIMSDYMRDNDALRNSLNIAGDDGKLKENISENDRHISEIQEQIKQIDIDILAKQKNIDMYSNNIKTIEAKEAEYYDQNGLYEEFIIDEDKRNADKVKLNILNHAIPIASISTKYEEVITELEELLAYASTREAKQEIFYSKVIEIKAILAEVNGILLEFVNCISIDDCLKEKASIIAKSHQKNSFVTDEQRREQTKQISYLKKEIFIQDSDEMTDELIMKDYNARISKIKNSISKLESDNAILQQAVDNLNLNRVYIVRDIASKEKDENMHMIKKHQRQIRNNLKAIEKFNFDIKDLEAALKSVKKVRKNSESLRADINDKLSDLRNNTYIDDKYNLDVAKREILIIDFIMTMYNSVRNIIDMNYLKMVDEIDKVTDRPYIGVIKVQDYMNKYALLNPDFIDEVKKSIDKIITQGSPEYRSEQYISFLKSQGLQVVNSGRPLINTAFKEDAKVKNLDGDKNGK